MVPWPPGRVLCTLLDQVDTAHAETPECGQVDGLAVFTPLKPLTLELPPPQMLANMALLRKAALLLTAAVPKYWAALACK